MISEDVKVEQNMAKRLIVKLANMLNKFRFLHLKLNENYLEYLKTQVKRSKEKYLTGSQELQNKRKEYLVDLLESKIDLSKLKKALVIGCRDSYEIDLLEKKGIKDVIGIDLFSMDKRIKVMDMHRMKFGNSMFDLVYCSHVLEHAFDYKGVLCEVVRVLKKNGFLFIEVPVNYKTNDADLHDYGCCDNLVRMLQDITKIEKFILKSDIKKGESSNYTGTDISRLFIRINKIVK